MKNLFIYLSGVLLVGAMFSCVHKPVKVENDEEAEEPAVEYSFCRNHFFQKFWGKDPVPVCPATEGLVLLPGNYPPGLVFLGYVSQPVHVQFLRDLIEKLSEDPKRPQVIITVPRRDNEEAYRLFQKYLDPPYSQFVQFIPMPSDDSLWTQDYFEVAISTVSGRASIIDLPSHGLESESIPSALALSCQMGWVRKDQNNEPITHSKINDFGGNIEAFPGNFLVVGDRLSAPTQELLEVNLSQDLIRVNTSWGEPGHVDEVYTVLPDYKKDPTNNCSFAVLYSSPHLALKIINEKGSNGKRDHLNPPIPEGEESIPVVERTDFGSCIPLLAKNAYLQSSPQLRRKCEELVKANQIYDQLINTGLNQIVLAIEKRTHCSSIKTVPLPVLYSPEKISSHYGKPDDHAVNINPNPINLISLGKVVVVARQPYVLFEEEIVSQINGLGLEPHLIDGSYVHYLRGGIHCTSNVVRMCKPQSGL